MHEDSTIGDPFDLPHFWGYFSERFPQPLVVVEGPRHIVHSANEAFLRLARGADEKQTDLIGQSFSHIMPNSDASDCMSLLDRVFRTGTSERLVEQKHGTSHPVYWSYCVWAILGGDAKPAGMLIQVTDSTETAVFRGQAAAMNESLVLSGIRQQELAEKAQTLNAGLQAAIKAKDHFMAVLGHELRNPLSPVLATASLLREDPRFDAETREHLDVICRNATLAARLIDDLLDVTRIKRGNVELERRPMDLRTVIGRARDDCIPDITVRELELDIDLGPQPCVINGDAGRLQQVFWNLIKNAVKFTPMGGCVQIRCRRDGDKFAVAEISDSGQGIPPEVLPRIFFAFEQGDRATGRQFGGLGLGLTISKSIVEMHGGTVQARSDGKGTGATFTVRLPLTDAPLPAEPEPGPEPAAATSAIGKGGLEVAQPSSTATSCTQDPAAAQASQPAVAGLHPPAAPAAAPARLRILLVEDHGDTARIMRRVLTIQGHEVQIAGDLATALRLTGEQTFDLLLSDLGLPDGSGWDLMRTLRAGGNPLPGIAMSGFGQDSDLKASRDAGFAAHLVKPVSLPKLKEEIARVVQTAGRLPH